ncbi:hypothetical protein COJ99_07285 [Bacillus cereus]|uniref:hypothetical protein n=1 Tax=Bacillus cereus TaxID=1396 RepID=UPI000BF97897|nr:hypothetical protein [Bacillus cereus]PFP72647.1 hypothetical protein COJ99_07285 [Bacillus cereus]
MNNNENLIYRRQFLLGSETMTIRKGWKKIRLNNEYCVTAHPDLSVTQVSSNNIQLTLLGYLFDPYCPKNSNEDILNRINEELTTFDDLCSKTYSLSGRWIIIFNDGVNIKILHDPCGMRQIYYTSHDGKTWCGSQPNIIAEELGLKEDTNKDVLDFVKSSYYENQERAWVGDGSVIQGVKHLLPNHYLDLKTAAAERFWVNKENNEISIDECVEIVTSILKGSLAAANNRFDMMLAVTAGWDSRVLLAASKDIKNDVYYFVSTMNKLTSKDADIYVPVKLLNTLNLKLNIVKELKPLDDMFKLTLQKNVSMARDLPKTQTIYYAYNNFEGKVNINGNASEIARCYFDSKRPSDNIDGYQLAKMEGYSSLPYAVSRLNEWHDSAISVCEENKIDILDLFYWEQRMGNWGTMYQAEQDIAIEEFCPFNNRRLLIALLKLGKEYRQGPEHIIYKKMINSLWPETLSEPINPLNFKAQVKKQILKMMPSSLKNKIKSTIRVMK